MQNHGTPELNLTEKLKEQVEEQVELSRRTMKDALQRLSVEWQRSMQHEMNTIANAMQEKGRELEKMQKKMLAQLFYTLKLPIGATIVLTMVISILWTYATGQITQAESHQRDALRKEVYKLRNEKDELLRLPITRWKNQGLDYLILPKGLRLEEQWLTDGRPAYKLVR